MADISGTWHKVLESELLQRSSHAMLVIGGKAYVFGGELRPRQPVDNELHIVAIDSATNVTKQSLSTGDRPSPRVGAPSAMLHGKLYLFSGRGGTAMAPIDEKGGLWSFDPDRSAWNFIAPTDPDQSYPPARSYHCMASDTTSNTLYVHAGCPESGRLSDLWAFNIVSRSWTELEHAPGPPRGGASIAFSNEKLYRMNGFDGKEEQGGSVDVYDPIENRWVSISYKPDGQQGPPSRSVGALVPVQIHAKDYLLTLFGEHDPSSLGHQGAGKMLSDVWAFDIDKNIWNEVKIVAGSLPAARGWFSADLVDVGKVLVHGGLNESNERLGDIWALSLEG